MTNYKDFMEADEDYYGINFALEHRRYDIEAEEKWKEWCNKMPTLTFKPEWEVSIIPPYGGAMARFCVNKGNKIVSVYFDAYSRLGWMEEPYWEIYPAVDGDVARYYLGEEKQMLRDIEASLNAD